ncbi:MAG: hypothetical protein P1V97_34195 [Planctomycetota bacterium]|nr:hypothetical protein [Planctomycetota bacterium]
MRIQYFVLVLLLLSACESEKTVSKTEPQVGQSEAPFERLSQYRFFTGELKDLNPNKRVTPYDLNSPLFSDYTMTQRFLWIPEGTKIAYRDSGAFDFPKSAVLIKNFSQLKDLRDPKLGERHIETRLLIHRETGWTALTYVWNAEQSDAILEIAGESKDIEWIHSDGETRKNHYVIPNVNDCKSCHSLNKNFVPIGPKAKHLNRDYPYSTGSMNQLQYWSEQGLLAGLPSMNTTPKLAPWDDKTVNINARARAYLDINCAHCHKPGGLGSNSGLDLRSEQRDPVKWGVMKAPVAAGRGSGGRLSDIVPGRPEESILTFRMASTDPGIAMPELGRGQNHDEGIQLITDWIRQLKETKSPK